MCESSNKAVVAISHIELTTRIVNIWENNGVDNILYTIIDTLLAELIWYYVF